MRASYFDRAIDLLTNILYIIFTICQIFCKYFFFGLKTSVLVYCLIKKTTEKWSDSSFY